MRTREHFKSRLGLGLLCVVSAAFGGQSRATTGPRAVAPLFDNGSMPTSIKHFGFKADRGLPLLTLPGAAEGDQIVVGAPPKIWRFVYATEIGLVYSNYFPSWLPTTLYSDNWYYIEDWRAFVFPSSYDSPNGWRLEVSNGLTNIECKRTTSMSGRDYFCPDDPELLVTYADPGAWTTFYVDSTDGVRQVFTLEGAWNPGSGSRYSLSRVLRKTDSGYTVVKELIRKPVDTQGVTTNQVDPDYKITKIFKYTTGTNGQSASAMTRLEWKDTNAETFDCGFDPTQYPQCNDTSEKCYDRRCQPDRSDDQKQQCYFYMCGGDYLAGDIGGLLSYLMPQQFITLCQSQLCGSDTSCWSNKAPCDGPPPVASGGDWKLARIITPQRISPSSSIPLIYTMYYDGQADPHSKLLRLVEDNKGPPGPNPYRPYGVSAGNAMQFGYDTLNFGRGLKGVSREYGTDRHALRFEFSDNGLLTRVWTDWQQPYHFTYGDMGSSGTQITWTTPFGLPTTSTYAPIGDSAGSDPSLCDPSQGCNTQLGLTSLAPPEGGQMKFTYGGGGDGAASGDIKTIVDVDGTTTVNTFTGDAYGRIATTTIDGCIKHSYDYGDGSFLMSATSDTLSVGGQTVTTTNRKLCSAASGSCPPYEYGTATSHTQSFANRASSTLTITNDLSQSGSKSTTVSQADGVSLIVAQLGGREPTFGYPATVKLPGASSAASMKLDFSRSAGDPEYQVGGSASSTCDSSQENCEGSQATSNQASTTSGQYFPSDGASGDLGAALAQLDVTAPKDAMPDEEVQAAAAQDNSAATSATVSGKLATTKSTESYDATAGNLLARTVSLNGLMLTDQYTWAQQEEVLPNVSGSVFGSRVHPTALTQHLRTVNGEVMEGEFYTYPVDEDGYAFNTHLGPVAQGHLDAHGNPTAPDYTITTDPRNPRSFILGCAMKQDQNAPPPPPVPCFTDLDCVCGGTCSSDGTFPGICYDTSPIPQGFICRQTFLGDLDVIQQFNLPAYTGIQNTDWYQSQCSTKWCSGSVNMFCDNPSP